jgi:hypothetical protein
MARSAAGLASGGQPIGGEVSRGLSPVQEVGNDLEFRLVCGEDLV